MGNDRQEVFAADGLPLSVGDVVTRIDRDISHTFYAYHLKRGVVSYVHGYSTRVVFEESSKNSYVGRTLGCPPHALVHLEQHGALNQIPDFDNKFREMLMIGG